MATSATAMTIVSSTAAASHRHVHGGHEGSCHGGYLGEHREQYHVHGHGHGGRLYDACESKRYDSCTGQYYA
ncbi:unnamed protein product [Miscanthus lutarioriparius]|uniref:Uncharacterized protein n=1 Tax=Miscanthus lutarioriparius TaxID=422564 RepID=A0A811P6X8_9POAL|nr:unnamed protein product [Miscanthus lutarioriparius]